MSSLTRVSVLSLSILGTLAGTAAKADAPAKRKVVCSMVATGGMGAGRPMGYTEASIMADVGPAVVRDSGNNPHEGAGAFSQLKLGQESTQMLMGVEVRLRDDGKNLIIMNVFQDLAQETPITDLVSTPRDRSKLLSQVVASFSDSYGTGVTVPMRATQIDGVRVDSVQVNCALWR